MGADWSAVRGFWSAWWSAVLLGLPAAGLLAGSAAVGGTATTALIGAGSALAGAAATRVVDLAKERQAKAQQALVEMAAAREQRRRDLDETRRVAYMALLSSRIGNPEVAATIVNAFAHHGLGLDPAEVARHVGELLTMASPDPESERWLQGQIDEINRQLGQ